MCSTGKVIRLRITQAKLSVQERRYDAIEPLGSPLWLRIIPTVIDERHVSIDSEADRNTQVAMLLPSSV